MRAIVLLLALASALTFAADNVAVAPRPTTSHKPQATSYGAESITIPQMLSYQGKLTDTLGQPVPNGNYQLTFRLYTQPTGGSAIWSEPQTIVVKSGLFSALLGAVTPIGSLPDAGALYLSLQVAADPELSPRLRIASAAYAYLSERAANADLLQGKDTAALDARYVNEGQASSITSNMMVDGTIAAADLGQMGASSGQVMKWNGSAWAPRNDSVGSGGGGDNAWVRNGSDSVLYTIHELGVARGGASNVLYGNQAFTHVNLGVQCTTGTSGQNYNYSTVGGGYGNIASYYYSTVAGGWQNTVSGYEATVGGGHYNSASNTAAVVGGGYSDTASGTFATVAGGDQNRASGSYAAVAGGVYNAASGNYATVGGGYADTAQAHYSSVLSGRHNLAGNAALDTGAVVAGGTYNRALGKWAYVGGGDSNTVSLSSVYATVGGGRSNIAGNNYAAVVGGYNDSASGTYSFVGGGASNKASATDAVIGGGSGNSASANYSFVGGGISNSAALTSAVVAGGQSNHASANWSTVGGGGSNIASGSWATVAGGYTDSATGNYSFATGEYNKASGRAATVVGGTYNKASGGCAAVLGGSSNYALDSLSSVTGGLDNQVSGQGSVILGGSGNRCVSPYTLMYGYDIIDTSSSYASRAILFSMTYSGALCLNRENYSGYAPIMVGSNSNNGNGAGLRPDGVWFDGGFDRNQCEGESLDGSRVLAGIQGLDIERWKVKGQETRRISPVSSDFNRMFGCTPSGEKTDTTSISPLDVASVSLAGVRELLRRLDAQQAEIEALKAELQRR